MDKNQLQQLRELPIEGVAGRLGLHVERHKSLCPFHDDRHPSLSFNVARNTFRCFVCGASGGTIDLVMRHLGKDFREACRWLADEHNIIHHEYRPPAATQPPPFDAARYSSLFNSPSLSKAARQFLFERRMLDPRVVRWCRLNSWRDRQGINWLQIPYFNADGTLTGIQNRNLDYGSTPEGIPRFMFPRGSRCGIYNLPVLRLLRPGDELFITEGCSDCWAMLSAGHKAIAIPSATLLSHGDAGILSQLHERHSVSLHMYPDCDVPGERLFLQLRGILPRLERHQLPPGCKDFSDYYVSSKKQNNV
ncbi:MAG: hypothetical protein J5676_07745 [Bacteroidaceae bacterium]|nr:hypothetical protein [Bacteroidaceae bacterium]